MCVWVCVCVCVCVYVCVCVCNLFIYYAHPCMNLCILYAGEERKRYAGMLEPLFGQVDDEVCFVGRMCFSASVRVVGVCVCIFLNARSRACVWKRTLAPPARTNIGLRAAALQRGHSN
jgi:hypothetical protein